MQAIVCASDTLALGVIKRLQELDREDVLVTGVGERNTKNDKNVSNLA